MGLKPDDGLIEAIEARVAEAAATHERWRGVLAAVRTAFGLPADAPLSLTVCPPAPGPSTRAYRRRATGSRTGRAKVRRGRATEAKALRTASGRKKAASPGSLTDRVLSTLTAFAAPMKKSAVVEACKAREADVTAELKRLRTDGQVTMVGERKGARWSLPKFANVLVAEDAA